MTLRDDLKHYPWWMLCLIAADVVAGFGFLVTMLIIGMRG